jgi:uncharacterized protein YunC (DUF1805 family)
MLSPKQTILVRCAVAIRLAIAAVSTTSATQCCDATAVESNENAAAHRNARVDLFFTATLGTSQRCLRYRTVSFPVLITINIAGMIRVLGPHVLIGVRIRWIRTRKEIVSEVLPRTTSRPMQFDNGCANGFSHVWANGQYCSIMTKAGIVGCGIYDTKTAAEFGQAIAIAKGTPSHPLVTPEDLLEAKIVDATPRAQEFGITVGMTGREATELMLSVTD